MDKILTESDEILTSRHFNLFDTILDVIKFVKNFTIKKHYFVSDKKDVSEVSVPIHKDVSHIYFWNLCALRHLEDLAREIAVCNVGDGCTYTIDLVSLRTRSEFYPVKSQTPDMNRFKKMVERI